MRPMTPTRTVPDLTDALPPHLAERVRVAGAGEVQGKGGFVLLWLHHACRDHDNAALDVALHLAQALDRPVLAYQGLGAGHRFDNDRHHAFILQGARELAPALARRGVRSVFHLPMAEPDGSNAVAAAASPLTALARRACVVVTDDQPAPPWPRWLAGLAARVPAPLLAVDSACIVPMALSRRPRRAPTPSANDCGVSCSRAWTPAGRRRPIPARSRAIPGSRRSTWTAISPGRSAAAGSTIRSRRWRTRPAAARPATGAGRRSGATAWPITTACATMPRWPFPAACPGCPPTCTRGWSRRAGSPPKRARPAAPAPRSSWTSCGPGASWPGTGARASTIRSRWRRCRAGPAPACARMPATRRHWRDLDALSGARSGVAVWDLAQLSLLRHGELHNNLRMSWGKALLEWSADPAQALARLVELNHRFALTAATRPRTAACSGAWACSTGRSRRPGRSPARCGRARWRRTPPASTCRRWRAGSGRPRRAGARTVAVLGAGIAGAAAARVLADAGHQVCVLEKSRGPGGRMATRREQGLAFDHGAQFLTVRDRRFAAQVRHWREAGLVVPWHPRSTAPDRGRERLLAVPGMNALARHLMADIELRTGTRVASAVREPDGWRLDDDHGDVLARADALVVTAPAPQAADLLRTPAPTLAAALDDVAYDPCWAALLALDRPVPGLDCLHGGPDQPLAFASAMASRPGRAPEPAWVVHAGAGWSRRHLDASPAQVLPDLVDAFCAASGLPAGAIVSAQCHRWRHALCTAPLARPALHDAGLDLAVAGDGLLGGRVESAWLSAAAAASLVRHWHLDPAAAGA